MRKHQLFCYDWLFYKCFSVPFFRNVLTRSGYWLLITQLNCLYCTTDFLALTWPDSFDTGGAFFLFFSSPSSGNKKKRKSEAMWIVLKPTAEISAPVTDSSGCSRLNTLFVITVNITSYEPLIVFITVNIFGSLCKSSPWKKKWNQRSVAPLPLEPTVPGSPLLLSVSEAAVKIWNKENVGCEHL